MRATKKTVFFTKNTGRKDSFLLDTRVIYSKESGYVVEKHAAVEAARPHLSQLITNYGVLKDINQLQKVVSLVPVKKVSEDVVSFPYISGQSAERAAINQLVGGQKDQVISVIEKVFSIVDSIPSESITPTESGEYSKVFGHAFIQPTNCIRPGVVDLNLDNFIIDEGGTWHMFDYEWCFNFPIPKDFLKIRVLWYFLARHREILEYHYNSFDGAKIIADRLFVPDFIYDEFTDIFDKSTLAFLASEEAFQQYVNKSYEGAYSRVGGKLSVHNSPKPLVGTDKFIKLMTDAEVKKMKSIIDTQDTKNKALKDELLAIKSSKTFRLARVISKLNPIKPL